MLKQSVAIFIGAFLTGSAVFAQAPAAGPSSSPSPSPSPAATPAEVSKPETPRKRKVLSRKHERPPLYDQFSGQGYGSAGCGLGSIVFGPKPGPIQIAAATLNAIALNQTFGITTGTSNCDIPESSYPAAAFIEANKATLANDLSRGEGESIANLASLFNCDDTETFTSEIRTHIPAFYDSTQSSLELTRQILKQLEFNPALSKSCTRAGV